MNNNKTKLTQENVNILKRHQLYHQNQKAHGTYMTGRTTCAQELKLSIINFRSLLSKKEETAVFINEKKPDVIIGTETWLKPEVNDSELFLDGYTIYRQDREYKSGGGVLLAVKQTLISQRITTEINTEAVFCKIQNGNKPPLIVGSVYRPPNSPPNTNSELCQTIHNIVSKHKNASFLIGGDFNLPDISWKGGAFHCKHNTNETNELFLETTLDLGLHQVVNENTREKATLDLLFTNEPDLIQNVHVEPGLSDHEIVMVEYKTNPTKRKKEKRTILIWKKADTENMKKEIVDFSSRFTREFTETDDINHLWGDLKNNMLTTIKKNVPQKLTTKNPGKPWITTELKRLLRRKKRWFKKLKSSPSEKAKMKYAELKRASQKLSRETYANFINNAILEDSNNKQFWAYVKSKNKEQSGIGPLIDKEGTLVLEATDKANVLNEQFSSVFSNPDGDFDGTLPISTVRDTLSHVLITEEGILKLFENLCVTKATGPDNIPATFLKSFAKELTPSYRLLFQASIDQGKVPDDWKAANVTPIFKKGDRNKPENYRPVSITSISCKLLEHIICSNIMRHLDQNDILTEAQHGFRRHRSCETQLITVCTDFVNSINEGGQTDAILLDFSKAFDKVHHQSLLLKLEHYGIIDNIHSWINSFLSNRSQKVMVDNKLSSSKRVMSGVPQGSVLGPLLFLVYINDMPGVVSEGSHLKLFADDSLLYRKIKTEKDTGTLQDDLNALQKWEQEWKMEFHPKKCQIISFTNKRNPIQNEYTIHGETLERTASATYLGVTMDEKLNWNEHIEKTCTKANQRLGFLKRILGTCPKSAKEKAYKAFVRPILEYSACVWDPHSQRNITKVEQVQRRAFRFVHSIKERKASISRQMEQHEWTSLRERRARQKVTMLHKANQGHAAIPSNQLTKNKRKEMTYCVPSSRVDVHLHSFFPDTARLWNSLPLDTRKLEKVEKFKTATEKICCRPEFC